MTEHIIYGVINNAALYPSQIKMSGFRIYTAISEYITENIKYLAKYIVVTNWEHLKQA